MPIQRKSNSGTAFQIRMPDWLNTTENKNSVVAGQLDSSPQETERIKKILRLGLVSLIGYELVQRTPQAKQYKNLIDVITNQRIALCHSLIKCSHGGLNGDEKLTPDEAVYRNAWARAIKMAEEGDRREFATELEHVESMLEHLSCQACRRLDNVSQSSLREVVNSARGCREVWSLIAFVNESDV